MNIVMVDQDCEKNFALKLIEYSVQMLPLTFELLGKFQLDLNIITTMGAIDVKNYAFEINKYSIKIPSLTLDHLHNSRVPLTLTITTLKMVYMCLTYVIRIMEQKMSLCQRQELCSKYVRTYNVCQAGDENYLKPIEFYNVPKDSKKGLTTLKWERKEFLNITLMVQDAACFLSMQRNSSTNLFSLYYTHISILRPLTMSVPSLRKTRKLEVRLRRIVLKEEAALQQLLNLKRKILEINDELEKKYTDYIMGLQKCIDTLDFNWPRFHDISLLCGRFQEMLRICEKTEQDWKNILRQYDELQ